MSQRKAAPGVFFVDDEPHILSSLARTLADEPYEVMTFEDPAEALAQITVRRPSVFVSDYYMPSIKGPDLLKKVLEIDEEIIRVILTGKPDLPAVVEATITAGVYSFLLKPWDADALRTALRNAVSQHEIVIEAKAVMARVEEGERREFKSRLRENAEQFLSRRNLSSRGED